MRALIIVQGIVQGVGYRFFVIEKAREYKLRGYVRNLPNGTVEVMAEGDKGMLQDFIEQLKVGPISAHITGIDVKWFDNELGFENFDIKF